MKPDYKLVAKAKYIHATADLASELWHEVYKRYYPAKQLDTLVAVSYTHLSILFTAAETATVRLLMNRPSRALPTTSAQHMRCV